MSWKVLRERMVDTYYQRTVPYSELLSMHTVVSIYWNSRMEYSSAVIVVDGQETRVPILPVSEPFEPVPKYTQKDLQDLADSLSVPFIVYSM